MKTATALLAVVMVTPSALAFSPRQSSFVGRSHSNDRLASQRASGTGAFFCFILCLLADPFCLCVVAPCCLIYFLHFLFELSHPHYHPLISLPIFSRSGSIIVGFLSHATLHDGVGIATSCGDRDGHCLMSG